MRQANGTPDRHPAPWQHPRLRDIPVRRLQCPPMGRRADHLKGRASIGGLWVLRPLHRALRLGAALGTRVADVIQFSGNWRGALGLHRLFAAGTSDNGQAFWRFVTHPATSESRQRELTAALWRFPADAGKTVAVTFLQRVDRKTASWTAAIKIPDHRTVSPQSLARVPRSGSGRGDGRICEAAQAAGTSVGGSAQISGDIAGS